MVRILSDDQLLQSFRPFERGEVQIPSDFAYPLAMKDYLAWTEPSGHRVFLVFSDKESLQGVIFYRTKVASDTPAAMCQWCHSVRGRAGVSLLSATVDRDRRIGVYLCSDLNCRHNLMSTPGVNDFHEGLSRQERVMGMMARMRKFVYDNLDLQDPNASETVH